jgi:hypothetical protein
MTALPRNVARCQPKCTACYNGCEQDTALGREPINLSGGRLVRVRYAPIATELLRRREMTRCATTGREQLQQNFALFDNLVGDGEQRRRYLNAKRFGSGEVDHQFKLVGLHDRKIGRLFALKDAPNVDASLTVRISNA